MDVGSRGQGDKEHSKELPQPPSAPSTKQVVKRAGACRDSADETIGQLSSRGPIRGGRWEEGETVGFQFMEWAEPADPTLCGK